MFRLFHSYQRILKTMPYSKIYKSVILNINPLLYCRTYLSGVRIVVGAGNFSLHHLVQTDSGSHPTSYPVGKKGSSPGGNHSPPSSAEVNAWSYTSTPKYPSMAWCSVKNKAQGQFDLYLT